MAEFTATEGTIVIPLLVWSQLQLSNDNENLITIQYVILPKVTKLTFQPNLNNITNIIPIKRYLEENLSKNAAITLNNTIITWYRGERYDLIVTKVETTDTKSDKNNNYNSILLEDIDISDIDLSLDVINNLITNSNAITNNTNKYDNFNLDYIDCGTLIDVDVEVVILESVEYMNNNNNKQTESRDYSNNGSTSKMQFYTLIPTIISDSNNITIKIKFNINDKNINSIISTFNINENIINLFYYIRNYFITIWNENNYKNDDIIHWINIYFNSNKNYKIQLISRYPKRCLLEEFYINNNCTFKEVFQIGDEKKLYEEQLMLSFN